MNVRAPDETGYSAHRHFADLEGKPLLHNHRFTGTGRPWNGDPRYEIRLSYRSGRPVWTYSMASTGHSPGYSASTYLPNTNGSADQWGLPPNEIVKT